jgi:hypothetical protein
MSTHKEWERRPDESDAQYAWFVGYLALGPGRSIAALVAALHRPVKKSDEKREGKKGTIPRNGAIEHTAAEKQWIKRAGAYDLALLQGELQTTGRMVVAGIREYAQWFVNMLRNSAVKAKTVDDMINGVQVLALLFPPETIAALLQSEVAGHGDAGGDGEPALQGIPSQVPR